MYNKAVNFITFWYKINNDFKKRKAEEEQKQKYLKAVYDKFLAVKAQYPNCMYDPPNTLSCKTDCPNPMCPGELSSDKTYSKMSWFIIK